MTKEDCLRILFKVLQRALCVIGIHNEVRTQHFGERYCTVCGGSYFGRVVEHNYVRTMGDWKWYSKRAKAKIESRGEMQDLINGTGRFE